MAIKVKEGWEEIYDKLIAKKEEVREKYEALYEQEVGLVDKMIGDCTEPIPDPIEEKPIEEEQPIVEENIANG